MAAILGEGDFRYEALAEWEKLPDGMTLLETPGVAVDSKDQVYAFTRNPDNPVIVFDRRRQRRADVRPGHLRQAVARHTHRPGRLGVVRR